MLRIGSVGPRAVLHGWATWSLLKLNKDLTTPSMFVIIVLYSLKSTCDSQGVQPYKIANTSTPTMRFILAISGKQYSGKDTLADLLIENYLGKYGFKRRAIADSLKIAYYDKTRLGLEIPDADKVSIVDDLKLKGPQVRTDLIAMGAEMRSSNPNALLDLVLADVGQFLIVPDVRLHAEVLYFANNSDYMMPVRVNAHRQIAKTRGVVSNEDDPTENSLDDFTFMHTLNNNFSIDALDSQARLLAHAVLMRLSSLYMVSANKLLREEK